MQAKPRRHPLIGIARRFYIGGALVVVCGIAIAVLAGEINILIPAAVMALLGAFVVWNGDALHTVGSSTPFLNGALALVSRGKLAEAERLHEQVAPRIARRRMVARVLGQQRALIALARGDAAAAAKHATDAIGVGDTGLFTRGWERIHRADGFALRAFARAALGEASESVEADAREAETSGHARASALARVALARAMVIAKRGDKTELGAHLAKHGDLILEYSLPRERGLLRALSALARSQGRSVYREPTRPEEDDSNAKDGDGENDANAGSTDLRSWIARVAPEAASFAPDRNEGFKELQDMESRIDPDAVRDIAEARRAAAEPERKGNRTRTLVLWGILVGLFVLIWQFLTPDTKTPTGNVPLPVEDAAPPGIAWSLVPTSVLVVFAVLVIGGLIARYRKLEELLVETDRDVALGDLSGAEQKLSSIATRRRFPIAVAGAQAQLASLAIRRGDFTTAIKHVDKGIAAVGKNATTQASASDLHTPFLIEQRAFALAMLGRFAEAHTEMAAMRAAYSSYAYLPRALFRVRLMMAVRQNDVAEAARIALSRTPDLALDLRTDLLADVVLAASSEPVSKDERQRIANELRDLPEIAAWIDGVAGHITKGQPPPRYRVTARANSDDNDDDVDKTNEDDDYYYEDADDEGSSGAMSQ